MSVVKLNTISLNTSPLNAMGRGVVGGAGGVEPPALEGNYFIATYDVTSTTSSTTLFGIDSIVSKIEKMYIDGVEVTPVRRFTFTTTGEHEVICVPSEPLTAVRMMFDNCSNLKSVNLSKLDMSLIDGSFQSMFNYCTYLTSVTFPPIGYACKATNMSGMFNGCSSLIELDVSNFNTSSVTTMKSMFSGCKSLPKLDVSNFNTSSVTNMGGMFNECSSLTELDVSNFNTSSVTNMNGMFKNCTLTKLDVSNFNTSSVTDMNSMFRNCALTKLDVSNFNTSSVTDMSNMFAGCKGLTELDVSNFNTSSVTNMSGMFKACWYVTSIIFTFPTRITYFATVFEECYRLSVLDLSSIDVSGLTQYFGTAFYSCRRLSHFNPFNNWKKANIGLSDSPISAQNVHDLIDRSMNLADGAEARTLTLKATTKADWEASEYYQTDLELLVTKGITIA